MATLPSPHTWTSGETPTAGLLNSDIRDGFGFKLSVPRVMVYNAAGQTGPSSIVFTLMTWDTEVFDTDNMHSTVTNPSRITFQTAGAYEVIAHVDWGPVNNSSAGSRWLTIHVNNAGGGNIGNGNEIGSDFMKITDSNVNSPQTNHLRISRFFNVGDYVECVFADTSNSQMKTIPAPGQGYLSFFAAYWLGAG